MGIFGVAHIFCKYNLYFLGGGGKLNIIRFYNATGKVRRMAKNIDFRMKLLNTPRCACLAVPNGTPH